MPYLALLVFSLNFFNLSLSAQTAFTRQDAESAKDLAAATGRFVIIDFYANWCGPCKTMDERVWSLDTVQALQENFVNIRIDASASNAGLLKYGIKAIPSLIIMDANGQEYFRKTGYMADGEVIELLNCFPNSMGKPYAADYVAREQPEAFNSHFLRARHYLNAARSASGSIAGRLAGVSNDALKEAKKIVLSNKEVPQSLLERLEIMRAENTLLAGRAKKALKILAALAEDLNEKNVAQACYVKGMAYRKTGKPELAQDCYDALQRAVNNEKFLAMYGPEN